MMFFGGLIAGAASAIFGVIVAQRDWPTWVAGAGAAAVTLAIYCVATLVTV